jgi:hypothetical protein
LWLFSVEFYRITYSPPPPLGALKMMDNIGYPKLELGLSAMSKDQLADSLAYNSLKVCIL